MDNCFFTFRKTHLNDDIIFSLQKKERDDMIENNNDNRIHTKYVNNLDNNSQNKHDRLFRFEKRYDESNQSWRNPNERYSPTFRRKRRSLQKFGTKYDNGGKEYFNEPEPEWFSDGPKSMTDFIDLKGFDDDSNTNDDVNDEDSIENRNADCEKDSFISFDMSKDDFSSLLETSEVSLLDNLESMPVYGISSRSEKWFKNKKTESSNSDEPLSSNDTLMDLFQKKNIDISQFSRGKKLELSDAVNVSELEASLINDKNNAQTNDTNDNNNDVMSKIKFLACNQNDPIPTTTTVPVQPVTLNKQPQQQPKMIHSNLNHLNEMKVNEHNPLMINNQMNNLFHPNIKTPLPNFIPYMSPQYIVPGPERPPINFIPPQLYPYLMDPRMKAAMYYSQLSQRDNRFMNFNPMLNHSHNNHTINSPYQFNPNNSANMALNENTKPINDDSMAHKLLKDSKLTPTSVYRKLKDHDQNKLAKLQKSMENLSAITEKSNDKGKIIFFYSKFKITFNLNFFFW